ncbi:hypothetical protein NEOLI_003271 [Neolecta irregularis DAH-3]|uniref:Uncharacterized protein n=1 Tax=Neolecta irregularis (strain DAH-3) TaxID=1198029 RepID=A0A1U7LRT5_NEOID|nr:hypothetical protein NEOLI_003271 [Neolecta irregularis DAH-3]|eukprot:OLL25293.1 hypothetical protein NEOLI_003271 [Neolecta irregularis DAH-3]
MLGTKGFSKRARELRHHAIDMLSHDLRLRSVTFSDVKTLNTEIFEVGNLRKEVIVVEFLIIRDGKAIGEVRAVEDGGKNIRLDVRLLDGTRFSTDHRREGKVIDAEHWTVRKG